MISSVSLGADVWVQSLLFPSSTGAWSFTATHSATGTVEFSGSVAASFDTTFSAAGAAADMGGPAAVTFELTTAGSGVMEFVGRTESPLEIVTTMSSTGVMQIDGVANVAVDMNLSFAAVGYLPVYGTSAPEVSLEFWASDDATVMTGAWSFETTVAGSGTMGVVASGTPEVAVTFNGNGLTVQKTSLLNRLGPGHHLMRQPRRRRAP